MLAKSEAELKQNDYAGAQASAEVAKKNADQATEIAKPLYEQAEQTSQNKARDEALARDASAIPGVDVRLDRRGDLQRLVIVVPELFSKRKPEHRPRPRRRPRRRRRPDQEVPDLPGPGDRLHRQPRQSRPSSWRSRPRARRPSTRRWRRAGVETERLMVSGLGGEDPFVDNKSAPGRAKNNRVEIVFLYH